MYSQIIEYTTAHGRYISFIGIFVVLFCAYLFSLNKKNVSIRFIFIAMGLHIASALFMLKTTIGQMIVNSISSVIESLYTAADTGIRFLFGALALPTAGGWGFIFAIKVLPIIIFFSAFMALLQYWGIIQKFVSAVRKISQPILGTTGPETTCAVANSFLSQTEAPMLIRQNLATMSNSELFVVMVSGFASISGAVLAVYGTMGIPVQHLLAASIMSIPASLLFAKIVYPAESVPSTKKAENAPIIEDCSMQVNSSLGAFSQGTCDGLQIALAVGAMLITFIAIIALLDGIFMTGSSWINYALTYVGATWQMPILKFQVILGWIGQPFAWLLGFSGDQARMVGEFLGIKVAVNEMVAFGELAKSGLSERSIAVVTYALCGFSNFSCIGIQAAGIGAMIPTRRSFFTTYGVRAMFAAALANIFSALIVNIIL
jgi:CNT family concentrative nucleoside transporter